MFCFVIPFLSLVLYYATIFGTYDTFTAEFKTPREWMVRASVFFGFPREGGAGGAVGLKSFRAILNGWICNR